MRISVVQMTPSPDLSRNLAEADRLLRACIAADSPQMVCLPECWPCIGADVEGVRAAAEPLPPRGATGPGGIVYEFLREVARRHGIHVHGGSISERDGDRLFNTTVVFGPDGAEIARYRKIHMADFTAPDGTRSGESDVYARGRETVVFDANGLGVGCAICYDLRFPELFYCLRRDGAELIVVPAVFLLQTGKDHWETLIRARAIETQCWIAAANTYGSYTSARGVNHTYGHSLICDPWGHVVAKVSDATGWASARVDRAMTERVRAQIPLMEHRKLIYEAPAAMPGITLTCS